MTDGNGGEVPPVVRGRPRHQIIITLEANGQVSITGPIDDAMVFFGLMEVASERIHAHHREKQARIIPFRQPPPTLGEAG